MAKTTEQKRYGLIQKIKVAQKQLALDDDNYRAVLRRITGKSSCKDCDLLQLQRVIAEFERLGFQPTRPNLGRKPLHTTDVSAMMNKLSALLATANKTWAYANGIAKKMFQKDEVNQLSAEELRKLIAALNYHVIKQQTAAINAKK